VQTIPQAISLKMRSNRPSILVGDIVKIGPITAQRWNFRRTVALWYLVWRTARDFGILPGDIYVIPDTDDTPVAGGTREDRRYSDKLHDLHLPDEDLKTYQHSVRRGDYVVSAEIDDEHIGRVQEIMRRPEAEAHDLDKRSGDFQSEKLDPYSDPAGRRVDEGWSAERDIDHRDPYTRSYKRSSKISQRRD
jgi:hypothetical protein